MAHKFLRACTLNTVISETGHGNGTLNIFDAPDYPSLVLVQPRKIHPYKTERLLMGRKESNQRNDAPDTTL